MSSSPSCPSLIHRCVRLNFLGLSWHSVEVRILRQSSYTSTPLLHSCKTVFFFQSGTKTPHYLFFSFFFCHCSWEHRGKENSNRGRCSQHQHPTDFFLIFHHFRRNFRLLMSFKAPQLLCLTALLQIQT